MRADPRNTGRTAGVLFVVEADAVFVFGNCASQVELLLRRCAAGMSASCKFWTPRAMESRLPGTVSPACRVPVCGLFRMRLSLGSVLLPSGLSRIRLGVVLLVSTRTGIDQYQPFMNALEKSCTVTTKCG